MTPAQAAADRAPEPCTTWSHRYRHYSTSLDSVPHGTGREGMTLCGADAFDQVALERVWESAGRKPVTIANLRECKLCLRAAHRLKS